MLATALAAPQGDPIPLNEEVKSLLEACRNTEAVAAARVALAYERTGSCNRSKQAAQESLRILESIFGPGDESLVAPLNVLTETFATENRNIDAMRMARRAIAIGPGAGLHYAIALQNLGALYEREGRPADARKLYAQAHRR